MSDVSVGHFNEQVRCKGNCHSLGEWRHLVSYRVAQSRRTRDHSNMIVYLVPTRSDVSAISFMTVIGCVPVWMKMGKSFITVIGCVHVWMKVGKYFITVIRCVPVWMKVGKYFITVIGCVPVWMKVGKSSITVSMMFSSLDGSLPSL